jgi:hypothetical protein
MAVNFCHIPVTGNETWDSFVKVEAKEQSKQWMHTHSPNKPKKFKHICQKADLWQLFSGTGKEC